jgi:hypothetical protein
MDLWPSSERVTLRTKAFVIGSPALRRNIIKRTARQGVSSACSWGVEETRYPDYVIIALLRAHSVQHWVIVISILDLGHIRSIGQMGIELHWVSMNRDLCLFITGCRQLLLFSTSFTIDPLVTMPVIATLLLRIKLDQCVDTHDRHTGLNGGLQLLDLAHAGLKNTSLQAIMHLAIREVQTVVLIVLRLGKLLRILRRGVCGVDGPL